MSIDPHSAVKGGEIVGPVLNIRTTRTKTNIYMMMKVQMKGRRVSLDPRARGESRGDSDQWSDEKGLHTKKFFAT